MNFNIIKLSDDGRKKLSLAFLVISLILTFFSAILLFNSVYVTFVVAPNLHSEKAVIRLIFTVIAMLAMQLVIYYLSGIFICRKCHVEAYKKNSRYLLRIWTFSGYSSILNVVLIGSMSPSVSNHIVRSMHHSMIRGMKKYFKDIQWKRIIDSLQFKLKCCGSHHYKDWHEISWISKWQLVNASSIGEAKLQSECGVETDGDRIYMPGVPWSCCRPDYEKQCFHDPIQQFQYMSKWDTLSEESVYNVGCVETLRQPVENSFLVFILFTYLILFLQIVLSVISRYLYTSYRNAVILGDPFGISPGWIYTRKTASEIMAESRISMSTSAASKSKSKTSESSSKYSEEEVGEEEEEEEEEEEVDDSSLMMR